MSDNNVESDDLLIALPVGLGHVFVICPQDEWHEITQKFIDPYEVELFDDNGEPVTVDLFTAVTGAIVRTCTEDAALSIFGELESHGSVVFDAICYAHDSKKKNVFETKFFTDVLAMIKRREASIYDTRAIGLCTSRIQFYYRGRKFEVIMNAKEEEPVYSFGFVYDDHTKCDNNYIKEMEALLDEITDPVSDPNDNPVVPKVGESDVADLAAFDRAFNFDDVDKFESM